PDDFIRLVQAYLTTDAKATPIVPDNKRFAENTVASTDNGAGNPMLYRVSTGHEGVFCEGCHGATHGIWPNKNPLANDNVTAMQLQGHTGTITECSTCHTGDLGNNLEGPHGMHPVGEAGQEFLEGGHAELVENNANECRACHGQNGEGTVLSSMFQERELKCDDSTAFCPTGEQTIFPNDHQVGCTECHENEL
ncbi:MAG: cytochrome C, partial [Proteobacteria bacterium]|nr:cytochrome C [Pseudomonadota bacterium]